jgi:biopolymer transport protein ExbD
VYNAQQVRSKQRNAIRRREEDIEQEEIEGGEINLIPYLDIVTNLMLFLLASVSAGMILGQINTTLPDRAPPATSDTPPPTNPDDIPVRLTVSVTRDEIILWSLSGLEGTLAAPKAKFPRTGRENDKCDGGYMCESAKCDAATQKCARSNEMAQWVYDYRALNDAMYEIANRRYSNKIRKKEHYQSVLMPDPAVPYGTIISVMSAMRCKMPAVGKPADGCYLPTDDENLKKAKDPIDPIGKLYDTTRAPYDPSKMALFQDIVFSPGVE